jgi:hypothetical protein
MRITRWLLLPFASIGAWYVAIIIGIVILSIAESFCPEDQQVSGMCVAAWWKPVETCIFCFSTGLSAFLVVATAFFVAPAARGQVVWLAFGIGSETALFFALGTAAWGMFASAVATGFLTALALSRSRFSRSNSHDKHSLPDRAP